jgi:alginate O-acetyltransferase complex protein AlgI
MLFNSLVFLVFAALFYLAWPVMQKKLERRWIYLTIMSFVFYGWWDWRFLFLIIFSGLIDYYAALAMTKNTGQRKLWLILSLVGNLGSLVAFKYSSFIGRTIEDIASFGGVELDLVSHIPDFTLVLPVGISFYTFQSMSYTIDVYRGRLTPTKKIFQFFAYLAMFPQLVAGPIVRAKDMLQQLEKKIFVSPIMRWHGVKLIVVGLFKKMVLADNIAVIVNQTFSYVVPEQSAYLAWVSIIAFAMQIYLDFSGYTDVARGLAKLMGFHFKRNFNQPYAAVSFKEFWDRWHISLSSWFRDYVYIPLGGSKKGKFRGHVNMWITMILSGLWHGASLNFLLWGVTHAILLSAERIFRFKSRREELSFSGKMAKNLVVLIAILISWVFFRAENITESFVYIENMFVFGETVFIRPDGNGMIFLLLALTIQLYFIVQIHLNKQLFLAKQVWMEPTSLAIMIVAIIFFRGPQSEFIYFQF